ncbi:glycosyl hydrolase family 18 protein [Nocardioides sp. BP30]|uniref:glycosyl hydrolase family 18 protein n=1 Tax=Nocardioides sp. BP30 TaxID=3036374 RepID=UPI0024692CC5|nr:glycosyl hydrolase family 18 protein [Nocardioides sp. BP30]WGL51688.1 glycosyl hydrolase family 18 protein [Nocardioides sp. BP30]
MAPTLRRAVVAVLALAAAAAPFGVPASAQARPAGLDVTGWVLSGDSPAVVQSNASGLTTVSVDGITLRHSGRALANPDRANALQLTRTGHAAGLHVELVLSNYSNRIGDFDRTALHRLLSSPRHRGRIAGQLARAVRQGGYDGVNVDLELVGRRDAGGLVAFVRTLQSRMPRARTVSIDVSAQTSRAAYLDHGYRLRQLGRVANVIDLMTYDDHGPGWSGPGPIGPLAWQRAAMTALLDQVPARKAQLGFGGYGYTWAPKGGGGTVTDAEARALVAADHATPTWNTAAGEWTARLSDGTVLWWADGRSYRLRLQLATSLGVRGVAVWRLGSVDRLS